MTSAIPIHNYHPPRHPNAITPTSLTSPTVNATPRSSASTGGYYASSSASTQHTSYWPNGASSVSTTSSASPRLNAGLAAAQYVTGRLHKRARSGHKTPEEIPDEMFDEGFFSGPGSPPPIDLFKPTPIKSKNKIKPLLKKVSASRNNSLDLSRSDGGLPGGVGLGIYDSPGYESSGIDEDLLETAFPKHPRKMHARTISTLSTTSTSSPLVAGANPTQPFAHPKRQVPRRGAYTPDLSRDGTSNESSSESEDEWTTRRIVLSGSSRSAASAAARGVTTINTHYDGRSTPRLATPSIVDLPERTPCSQTTLSPTTPASPVDSLDTVCTKKPRGRQFVSSKEKKRREASPTFAASVTAARIAWEAKEEKKEEKREKKRRRSEAKDGERRNSSSSHRTRGNSGSSGQTTETIWDDDVEREPGYREKDRVTLLDDDEVYTGRGSLQLTKPESTSLRGENATGKKWGISIPEPANDPQTGGDRKRVGLKKRWLGFIVWVRIGMVRLGRKIGF